jgi:hypothetical protein
MFVPISLIKVDYTSILQGIPPILPKMLQYYPRDPNYYLLLLDILIQISIKFVEKRGSFGLI